MGMGGPVGLDYNVLPTVFRLRGIPRSKWSEMFDLIQVMEVEALETMSESLKSEK